MPLSTREVEKIADLANLKFAPGELERFVQQFQKILDYFAQLDAVSTDDIEPTYHALEQDHLETPMRKDERRPSFAVAAALANAPDSSEDHFRVPAVIE